MYNKSRVVLCLGWGGNVSVSWCSRRKQTMHSKQTILWGFLYNGFQRCECQVTTRENVGAWRWLLSFLGLKEWGRQSIAWTWKGRDLRPRTEPAQDNFSRRELNEQVPALVSPSSGLCVVLPSVSLLQLEASSHRNSGGIKIITIISSKLLSS